MRSRVERGLTERRALAVECMSASAFRYELRPDRNVEARVIKCLTIVYDSTHEAVAIQVERAISGHGVALRLIEPGKPERLIENFNGRPRRMPQRALVRKPAAHPCGHRTVAPEIQRGKTEESTRRADARRLCQADGRDRLP